MSYFSRSSQPGSTFDTLVDLLVARANQHPDRIAFSFLSKEGSIANQINYGELELLSLRIAATLQDFVKPGERALLLFPPGEDFITAFLGCVFAGIIAVPIYPPNPQRVGLSLERMQAVINDADPSLVLTNRAIIDIAGVLFDQIPGLRTLQWIATDLLDCAPAMSWRKPPIQPESLALLQYNSGTTQKPRGVMITHGNILHNSGIIADIFSLTGNQTGVSWLPPYHNMGLIGGILQTIYSSNHSVLLQTESFLNHPGLWLKTISDFHAHISGGPNFAYELCVRRISEVEKEILDLQSWQVAFVGSEPAQEVTMDRFFNTFSSRGFIKKAFYPCYGLAKATLLVSGHKVSENPTKLNFPDNNLIEIGMDPTQVHSNSKKSLISSGKVHPKFNVIIVDPETGCDKGDGVIGEIWVSGPSISPGYWSTEDKTKTIFHAYESNSGKGPFIRTGDLGFILDNELFVSGKIEDLIILNSKIYFPTDIEKTIELSLPSLESSSVVFTIQNEKNNVLVILVEIKDHDVQQDNTSDFLNSVKNKIRSSLYMKYEMEVSDIRIVKKGHILRNTGGFILRQKCYDAYLAGNFEYLDE